MNLGVPATGHPKRGEPLTSGKLAGLILRNLANAASLSWANVWDVRAQVTQFAVSIYQARLFFSRLAITNEFH